MINTTLQCKKGQKVSEKICFKIDFFNLNFNGYFQRIILRSDILFLEEGFEIRF